MKPPQQRRHLLMWVLIAPVAVVVFILAILWRPPQPIQDRPDGATTYDDSVPVTPVEPDDGGGQ